MDDRSRVRVNLAQGEVEVEGSEAFVARYGEQLSALIERLLEGRSGLAPAPGPAPVADSGSPLGSFGEFIHHLPSSATEVDKMLAAGFWAQMHNPDRAFSTAEASRRLAEYGFRIGNPSQCVRQSLMAKRVFVVQRGRYRVSHLGKQYLRQLMGEVVPLDEAAQRSP